MKTFSQLEGNYKVLGFLKSLAERDNNQKDASLLSSEMEKVEKQFVNKNFIWADPETEKVNKDSDRLLNKVRERIRENNKILQKANL